MEIRSTSFGTAMSGMESRLLRSVRGIFGLFLSCRVSTCSNDSFDVGAEANAGSADMVFVTGGGGSWSLIN